MGKCVRVVMWDIICNDYNMPVILKGMLEQEWKTHRRPLPRHPSPIIPFKEFLTNIIQRGPCPKSDLEERMKAAMKSMSLDCPKPISELIASYLTCEGKGKPPSLVCTLCNGNGN